MKSRKGRTNLVKAKPGATPPVQFPGKDVMIEAKKKGDAFKKGGPVKEQMAEGGAAKARMDKAPRKASGGGVNLRGRSPFSNATSMQPAKSSSKYGDYS